MQNYPSFPTENCQYIHHGCLLNCDVFSEGHLGEVLHAHKIYNFPFGTRGGGALY
jgi:hypothetical protein